MLTKGEILGASPINVGDKEEVPTFKRAAYEEVSSLLHKTKLNVSITGLRRVGKTVLIKQILNEWEGKAFYFSFDEPRYQNYESLKRVIEVFLGEADKPLIALDEVGKIKDWAGVIKKYYDQGKARFLISGSSSLSINKGKESLAGRIFEVMLPPLQYNEFIRLAYGEVPLSSFSEVFKRRVKDHLDKFLRYGSFPETIGMDEEVAKRYVETSVVSKVIFDDIPEVFRIEYRSKLYEAFLYMVEYSGNLIYESNLAEAVGLNKTTVKEYLFYLEQAFLSYLIYNQGSFAKKLRKTKKGYVAAPALYSCFASAKSYGQLAEVSVFDKLLALRGRKPIFYRDNQKREVDFIDTVPIEVKFQRHIGRQDLRHILYYMEKYKKDVGLVITKEYLDEREFNGKRVVFVPLHVFLSLESLKDFPS